MPFTFEPTEITSASQGSEIRLRGRLRSGAYFGPESVIARSADGKAWKTHIHTHGLEAPEGWPVLAEHRNTVLVLTLPAPPRGFEIVQIEGLGSADTATHERLDVSGLLDTPGFWAMQVAFGFESETVDDPALEWFGFDTPSLDAWYAEHIQRHQQAGAWPCVRVPLPGARYIQYEMAAGVEQQDRIWIGDDAGQHRVLLGYQSGHFSLPALRPQELSWLAAQTGSAASNLLWLRAAYIDAGDAGTRSLAQAVVAGLPGLLPGKASEMADTLIDGMTVQNLAWTSDPRHGWINDGKYSQRNPDSRLSTLEAEDFAYLRDFFA